MILYIIIEYISGKREVYHASTKADYMDIIYRLSAEFPHIEDIEVIEMPGNKVAK